MHTKPIHFICLVSVSYMACPSTANAEIVGWWKFDKGSGTVARDSSGCGNDLLFNGDPQWVAGCFGGGLEFDGSGDYLDRGVHEPSLDIVGELTLTAWVKPGAMLRDHKIGGNVTTGPNGGGYMMGIYSNNQVELEIRSGAGTSAPPNRPGAGTALQAGTWYFLSATYAETAEGGVIRTYVDGVFDQEQVTTMVMNRSAGTFKIGRDPSAPGSGEFTGVMDDVRVYNHVLTEDELREAMLGKGPQSKIAFAPFPEDQQVDVPRDAVLGWTPGIYGQTHDVYFGTVLEGVNNADRGNPLDVLVGRDQDANTYDPFILNFGKMYYWRIDDINATDTTIHRGNVWRFQVEPFAYPILFERITPTASSSDGPDAGPERTIDGSGLVDDLHSMDTKAMWLSGAADPGPVWIRYDFDKPYKLHQMRVWNYNGPFILTGYGLKDVTVEYSEDGDTWTMLPGVDEFGKAPGADDYACNTTIDLAGVVAQSVKITANSNWGGPIFGQYGLSEVRFLYIPVRAREPQPASGQAGVDPGATLSWRVGREAASHEVYLGADGEALALVDTVSGNSYALEALGTVELGQTYYWKVNEVNEAASPSFWDGDLWSFSTAEYLVVDDFESYDDDWEHYNRIFQVWIDGAGYTTPEPGLAGNGSGALVGTSEAPWVEQDIVHSGKQSMPLFYDNTGVAAYSETERAFSVPQDWTRAGARTLVLYFHGTPGNTGQLYVKVNGVRVDYDGDAADIGRPLWRQWNIDLASLGVDLQNVRTLGIGIDNQDATGTLYVDDIRLYAAASALSGEEIWIEAEAAASITPPLQIFSAIPGASGGRYMQVELDAAPATANPPAAGIATYNFTVRGGTYVIRARIAIPGANQDAFWFRIPGATVDKMLHSSGWCQWNTVAAGASWHWDDVHSSQSSPANQTVHWTIPAGSHTLQVAYMDVGTVPPMLDAVMIVKVD